MSEILEQLQAKREERNRLVYRQSGHAASYLKTFKLDPKLMENSYVRSFVQIMEQDEAEYARIQKEIDELCKPIYAELQPLANPEVL